MTAKKKKATGQYRVNRGLSWGDDQRAEPGDIIEEGTIPEKSAKWLLEQGHIEPYEEAE